MSRTHTQNTATLLLLLHQLWVSNHLYCTMHYTIANYLSVDLVRFQFRRLFWVAHVALMLKMTLKTTRGQLFSEQMRFENTKICFIHFYFYFLCDYDLNLCRYLNPALPPMGDFASLYFLIHHTSGTSVCGTLFLGIKLSQPDELFSPKQTSAYKSAILAEIIREAKSPNQILNNGTVQLR